MSAKVAVIIPVYNRLELLKAAVESVKQQTFTDWELIIVDDGSEDDFAFLEMDNRIKVIKEEHCGLPSKLRNIGASASKSEYIAFLDSDDLWVKDKLEKQIALFEKHPDIGLIHSREIWKRGDKIVSQKKFKHKREGFIFEDALEKCIIGPSTTVIRREFWEEFGGFDPEIEVAEDYELWLRFTSKYPVHYIDEPLVIKQAGEWDQLSEKYGHIEFFRINALEKLVQENYFSKKNKILAKRELAKKAYIFSHGAFKRNKLNESKKYYALGKQQHFTIEDLGLKFSEEFFNYLKRE